MTEVIAREGESVESLLKRFNRKVQIDGILQEIKRREFYVKPSVIRKRKAAIKKRKSTRIIY